MRPPEGPYCSYRPTVIPGIRWISPLIVRVFENMRTLKLNSSRLASVVRHEAAALRRSAAVPWPRRGGRLEILFNGGGTWGGPFCVLPYPGSF